MMSSPASTSIMLSPISPSPPRGIRRTAGSAGASIWSGSGRYAVLTAAPPGYHRRLHRQKKGPAPCGNGERDLAVSERRASAVGSRREDVRERSRRQTGEPRQRENLGADISIEPGPHDEGARPIDGHPKASREGVGEILPPLTERGANDRGKAPSVTDRDRRRFSDAKVDHGGFDLRQRAEGARRNREAEAHVTGDLGEDGERAVRLAPWQSRDALGHLQLQHQRHLVDGPSCREERGQDRL